MRFWIVFARLYENVILNENGTIFDGNMRFTSYLLVSNTVK